MDSIEVDNNIEGIEDEQFSPPCSSHRDGIFGEPEVLPRIGDQYQAEIPQLIVECNRLQLINEQADSEVVTNVTNYFSLGLPISLMWSNCEVEHIYRIVGFENRKVSWITLENEDSKLEVESLDAVLDDGKDVEGFSNLHPTVGSDSMDVDLVLPVELKTKLDLVERGLCPLPGSLGESWSNTERDSFLLGLYIFGKNFILVKRFVESKGLGDILSFYYGKFYRSDRYRRWSECQKLRSRRCIYGQKIFTGWRQQELLSRIFSHVSEECQNKLREASRNFGEVKVSFEEYVFTLKDIVGINMLIEAVGIGKGKRDLTGISMEPIKSNHVFFVRPEIPTGKACSSLTSADIIKFLTGNFRLSKARSSDLFWEAVWPRLLARGWHSEQPKDHAICGSKHSLVFLIPGVRKFSRRRLVKGNHYFDSVTDVLNKVVSDPQLLEIEAAEGSGNKEYRWEPPKKQDLVGLSNKQRHCYLQPRNSNCNRDLMKFTIVDTSVVHGTERPKVRELRSLPVQTTSLSTPCSLSSETEQDTSEEREDEVQETNTPNPAADMTEREVFVDLSDCASMLNALDPTIEAVENHKSPKTSLLNDNHQRKQSEDESYCQSNLPDAHEDMDFQVSPQNLASNNYLVRSSPEGSNEGSFTENFLGREVSPGKPQPRTLIDLNLPYVSPNVGTEEPFIMDMTQNNDNSCPSKLSFLSETSEQPEPLKLSDGVGSTEQQPTMNNRRQSMRSRPLTTKAWESLEYDFFNTRRKRKGVELTQNKSVSKSSRQIHGTAVCATLDNGTFNGIIDARNPG